MNFLKWFISILLGWFLYLPKKLFQNIEKHVDSIEFSWNSVKTFLNQSEQPNSLGSIKGFTHLDQLILLFFFLCPALIINESYVASCLECQSFIRFMSSLLPGILMMSHHSAMPQTVLLELTLAYSITPLLVLLFFFRNRDTKYDFIDTSSSRFTYFYLLSVIFLCFIAYISVKSDISFLFHPHPRERFLDFILKTKIGLSFWIWLLTILTASVFARWVLINIEILKKLNKTEK